MQFKNKSSNALYAAIVGDALGVPFESSTRQEMALCAVKNMLGYGRYDQPVGTWSDDTSMTLATMASLFNGYDINKIADYFCNWLFDGEHTPYGYAFDVGLTTFTALEQIKSQNKSAHQSGSATEDDNGNGSLMRILPIAIYFTHLPPNDLVKKVHEVSAITHSHPRALIGCGIYALILRELLLGKDRSEAMKIGIANAVNFYGSRSKYCDELAHFQTIVTHKIDDLDVDDIYSSGYIVHTLEAALWCFLKHDNTKDILLAAVNLGLDTDTTGTVAGGLAGATFGINTIPTEWLNSLAKKSMLDDIIEKFIISIPSVS